MKQIRSMKWNRKKNKIFVLIYICLIFSYCKSEKQVRNDFNNRQTYTFKGCYGLPKFCHNGYYRCKVDCKLIKKGECEKNNMPYMWNSNKRVRCK